MDSKFLFGDNEADITTGICDVLLGPRMGEGIHRVVFPLLEDNGRVVKVGYSDDVSPNVMEWNIYNQFCSTKQGKKWLAQCFYISGNGRAMTQERLKIFNSMDDPRLPKKIPSFLLDTKVQNWGVARDGTVKCCDYAIVKLLQGSPWRLVNASWWEHPQS